MPIDNRLICLGSVENAINSRLRHHNFFSIVPPPDSSSDGRSGGAVTICSQHRFVRRSTRVRSWSVFWLGTSGTPVGRKNHRQAAVQRGEIIKQFDFSIAQAVSHGTGALAADGDRPSGSEVFKLLDVVERCGLLLQLGEGKEDEIG